MWYLYWKRANVQGPSYFLSYLYFLSLLLTHFSCWQAFFRGLFLDLLILCLLCLWLYFVSHLLFVLLTLVILKPVCKCLLSATVNHWILFLILVTPPFLFCWHNLLLNCLVCCSVSLRCSVTWGELDLPYFYFPLCWETFLVSENTCLSADIGASALTGAPTTACHLSACWHSRVAVPRLSILPSSLGVRAEHLPPVFLMGSQDHSLPKAHGSSLPRKNNWAQADTLTNRLSRLSFSQLTQLEKTTWDETGLLCASPSAAGQGFKNADVALLAFRYGFFGALLPGVVKTAAQPGVEELKAFKEMRSRWWKTPVSTKWECWHLCWWHKSLGWNLKLWCQVTLSVPAIAITAFGPVAATQETEKTTALSGEKFAQPQIWCATIAELLPLLCSGRSLVWLKHLNRRGPVFQRCLWLVSAKWSRGGKACLLTSFDWCRSLFYCFCLCGLGCCTERRCAS